MRMRGKVWGLAILVGTGTLPSCEDDRSGTDAPPVDPDSLLANPLEPFPADFADVGLYPAPPQWDEVPAVAVRYEPVWPLWSNGSEKHRYLVLPEGGVIDNAQEPWVFPPGTLIFKTFLYPAEDDGLVPVETRILRLTETDGWEYAVYLWSADGSQAEQLDFDLPTPVHVDLDGGFTHTVPAELECRSCHESSFSEALGLSNLQLADALPELQAAGLLAEPPPAAPERIEHASEATRQILGSWHGNCVHCHNGTDGPSSSFDLRYDVALQNTIDRETESSASAAGIRIVPGEPEESILFLAVSGETDDPEVKEMPPVGVDVLDGDHIEALRRWILELPPA